MFWSMKIVLLKFVILVLLDLLRVLKVRTNKLKRRILKVLPKMILHLSLALDLLRRHPNFLRLPKKPTLRTSRENSLDTLSPDGTEPRSLSFSKKITLPLLISGVSAASLQSSWIWSRKTPPLSWIEPHFSQAPPASHSHQPELTRPRKTGSPTPTATNSTLFSPSWEPPPNKTWAL